jgi:radical SAM superfamily enzyme YgiQ (UPF0313 family)
MRIVLVYPDVIDTKALRAFSPYVGIGKRAKPYPPLGLLRIAQVASRHADVYFIDNAVLQLTTAALVEKILGIHPDVVGFGGTFAELPQARAVARKLRERGGVPLIYGGPNASARPKQYEREFTHIVSGLGEIEFDNILQWVCGPPASALPRDPWNEILPARGLLHVDQYDREALGAPPPVDTVITSTGCPYSCRFCSSRSIWGKYKERNYGSVVQELRWLHDEWGTSTIFFRDDYFPITGVRTSKIASACAALDMTWVAQCRIEGLTAGKILEAQDMGCVGVSCGFESIHADTLAYLGKGFSPDDVKHAIDLLDNCEMPWVGGFIVGTPNEDRRKIQETARFALNARERAYSRLGRKPIMRFVGYPVSQTYVEMKEKGYVEFDWQDGELLVPRTEYLTSKEVDDIIREEYAKC